MRSSSTSGTLQAFTLRVQFCLPPTALPPEGIACSPEFLWQQLLSLRVPLEAHYSSDICSLAIHRAFCGESQPVYQLPEACFLG